MEIEQDTEKKFTVDIAVDNGIRHGEFNLFGFSGKFPNQIITTANLNHMRAVKNHSIDFKTRVLEVFFRGNLALLGDEQFRTDSARELKKVISANPDKLCLLQTQDAKSKIINKEINLNLIKLQLDAGFRLVKVYIKHDKNVVDVYNEYISKIPDGKFLLPVLDEKLKTDNFEKIYNLALGEIPIIGFLGRDLSKKHLNIKENYLFIQSKKTDNIIRLVSGINKRIAGDVVKSILYAWLGYDMFSFYTRKTRYTLKLQPLQVIQTFRYENLEKHPDISCEVRVGKKLAGSVEFFRPDGKETVPCSIYSHIELNREFEKIYVTLTEEKLKLLVEEEIRDLW